MDKNLIELIRSSIFYCRKVLENGVESEWCVSMMPLHEHKCCTYNFTAALTFNGEFSCESVPDVTTDIRTAECIFNALCVGNVSPCHLFDVISDLIA